MHYFVALALLFSIPAFAQPVDTNQQEAIQLKKILLENHIQPRIIDDKFSSDVLHLMIDHLDPDKLFFTDDDIRRISQYEYKIDDEFNGTSWKFPVVLSETFKFALKRSETHINEVCAKPFDYKNFRVSNDSGWALDETALKDRWRDELKIRVWEELTSGNVQSSLPESEYFQKNDPEARQRVRTAALRGISRMLNASGGFEKWILTEYFRAFSTAFDPHSVYLSPTQMENFISALSTEGFYLGFSVKENEQGNLLISALHPGGPAWKSGAFNVGDVIQRIRWSGDKWIEVKGMTPEELNEILRQSNDRIIEFVLSKGTGQDRTVALKKEKINTEESIVRSFLLEGRRKIGYINLPDFYTNWGEAEGTTCANDVAKEILKLKKENIDGLVLDVRYNGGGSLAEATAMAGIFIDAGPIGIEKEKGKEPITIKDINRGTIWDGPLVLMVNGSSASASEFLAAALQDYRRGIIVGSPTYGKAIGQKIFHLETAKPVVDFSALQPKKGWGFCTVTTLRLYRINGRSIQLRGVQPDIEIPEPGTEFEEGEVDSPFALQPDSVFKKTYAQQLGLLPLTELKAKSLLRVSQSESFREVNSFQQSLHQFIEHTEAGNIQMIQSSYKNFLEASEKYQAQLYDVKNSFVINLHNYDKPRMQVDEYAVSLNNAWITNLSKDIWLEESYQIICDYIETIYRK